MRASGIFIALALTSTISLAAQPVLTPARLSLIVVDATLTEVFTTITRTTGTEILIDASAAEQVKIEKLGRVNFENAQLEDALRFLTNSQGLTFEIVDEKTVRIRVKQ